MRLNLNMLLLLLPALSSTAFGKISLPRLISDGMVLQRDAEVKIWGWAAAGEAVAVNFLDAAYPAVANARGEWQIKLPPMKAGGPHSMKIIGSDTLSINEVWVGEVWICSGQSNMEISMERARPLYESEIAHSHNPSIRYFEVPKTYDFNTPQKDISGGRWRAAGPESILSFSAVAYFFALELYDKYQVPVGLINTSLGGSPAEAWMSEEALEAFPVHYREAQRFKDKALIEQIESQDKIRIERWYKELNALDAGHNDPGGPWHLPGLDASAWPTMPIPGYWADEALGAVNGVVWFRREIELPAAMAGKAAKLLMGRIVDADSVFVNGIFIGTTSYQYPPRRYSIPAGILREGTNTIAARVVSNAGRGGFVPDKPYQLACEGQTIGLSGEWSYKLGAEMEPLGSQTFIRWKPLGLFNAMISPLLNYRIRGAIWYQGESNTKNPEEYRELFPALIKDWRRQWGQGDFPFLFVQLANFMEAQSQPSESSWAALRQAQLETLAVPNTGMAVAIDIGEWNDIHPLNKKDVGKRLALVARKVAYGEEGLVHSGPIYQSMQIDGNRIILSFEHAGGGLLAKGGKALKHFAIAGADGQFAWAEAEIEEGKVAVWNDGIPNPTVVRYAWANNPEGANLYNKEGLPASPFRTDGGGEE